MQPIPMDSVDCGRNANVKSAAAIYIVNSPFGLLGAVKKGSFITVFCPRPSPYVCHQRCSK